MRKSGFLVLLLTALLVILPVVAFAAEASNSSFELSSETKIVGKEEVAGIPGEIVTAFAVDTRSVGIAMQPIITAHSAHTGLHNYSHPVQAIGGGAALRGEP